MRLLLAWTVAINLTSVRDPEAVAIRHVVDSLTALPILRRRGATNLLDLGSGGGFPGLPLAVALKLEQVLLVDSVAKKARFLEVVVDALGLRDRIAVATRRAEELAAEERHREHWSAVTARAVAPIAELVELAFPLLEPLGVLVAWKGAIDDEEMSAAGRALKALGGGAVEVVEGEMPELPKHRLVVIEKHGPSPASFPRDPTSRRRRPL